MNRKYRRQFASFLFMIKAFVRGMCSLSKTRKFQCFTLFMTNFRGIVAKRYSIISGLDVKEGVERESICISR